MTTLLCVRATLFFAADDRLNIDFSFFVHNRWLIGCFTTYLLLIFGFAGIYFALYRQRPHRFLFLGGIEETQRSTYRIATGQAVEALTAELELLDDLQQRLAKGSDAPTLAAQNTRGTLPSGRGFIIYLKPPISSGTPPQPMVELRNADGTKLAEVGFPSVSWPWQRIDEVFFERRRKRETRIALLTRRLQALEHDPYDIWSYWDFLYFSTIAQTTVGFGDILPNATAVRLLVVCQIILGYALLVVVLNVVLRS